MVVDGTRDEDRCIYRAMEVFSKRGYITLHTNTIFRLTTVIMISCRMYIITVNDRPYLCCTLPVFLKELLCHGILICVTLHSNRYQWGIECVNCCVVIGINWWYVSSIRTAARRDVVAF